MPNHVENILIVFGDAAGRAQFWKACSNAENSFSFAGLVPRPTDERLTRTPVNVGLGYAASFSDPFKWEYEHWGTKWDAYEVQGPYTSLQDLDYVRFESAWEPPVPWLRTVSEQFPKLFFQLMYCSEDYSSMAGIAFFQCGLEMVNMPFGHASMLGKDCSMRDFTAALFDMPSAEELASENPE